MRDPRDERLSPRDLRALVFVGEGYEVAQYQLQEAIFKGRSPTVASRFVVRARSRGLLVAERLMGIGMNRLRLTRRGRELLVRRGVDGDALFVPKKPTALKDLAHRLWINDLRVVMGELESRPDRILPAWAIERRVKGEARTIPDLLVVRREPPLTLALEVDLGGEPLRSVFVKKLALLADDLEGLGAHANAAIVVLTTSERRAGAIREAVDDTKLVTIEVATLPVATGAAAIEALRAMWRRAVLAAPQDEDEKPSAESDLRAAASCRLGSESSPMS